MHRVEKERSNNNNNAADVDDASAPPSIQLWHQMGPRTIENNWQKRKGARWIYVALTGERLAGSSESSFTTTDIYAIHTPPLRFFASLFIVQQH